MLLQSPRSGQYPFNSLRANSGTSEMTVTTNEGAVNKDSLSFVRQCYIQEA